MSYKTLHDIYFFITLSVVAMLFKVYPTCIISYPVFACFLKNIFFKRHILFNRDNMLY